MKNVNMSSLRLTLDTEEDYKLLQLIFNSFDDNNFSFNDIGKLYNQYSEMFEINKHIEQKNYHKELAEYYAKQV